MNREQALLTRLMEECAEVTQRVSKVLNFGWDETQPGHDKNNFQRLADELNDLVGVVQMIERFQIQSPWNLTDQYNKRLKVEKYLTYSKELGILTD